MQRIYLELLKDYLKRYRQMFFLAGPRQVGKTTCGKSLEGERQEFFYLNWDHLPHRELLQSADELKKYLRLDQAKKEKSILVLDELHKYAKWKSFLKGFFDVYAERLEIVVTGSARLDTYQKSGDSLMGRYFSFRMHPLSVAELISPIPPTKELRSPGHIDEDQWKALNQFGGFPEPFLMAEEGFSARWGNLRRKQLFQEDLRDLTRLYEIQQIELLAHFLTQQVGQLTSYTSYAKKIGVASQTIKHWLAALESIYYCYSIRPWSTNLSRSLIKEPKYYLWDWSLVEDEGARFENLIASHLLKAVHYWNDAGMGDYGLYFLRDKEKREVDFIVTKGGEPWFLVEAKISRNNSLSKSLFYYQEKTGAPHAFQVVRDLDHEDIDCFSIDTPVIVPAKTFLSQLV